MCVCVNHLKRCKTSKFRRGPMGTWMAWANENPSKLLCKRTCNFWIVMGVDNPRTTMPFFNENHIRIFELSTWTDEGDFSFIFLHSWRNLRQRWISCPFQFSAYISEFFLASIDFIPFFKVAKEKILSLHTKHPPVPVRCNWIVFARQMHSATEIAASFWASVCVWNIWIDVKPLLKQGGTEGP